MKKRIISVSICLLSVAFLLSACGAKDGGEAKAKEAGLALINRVFDTNQTQAEVKRLVNNQTDALQRSVDWGKSKNLERCYTVTVSDGTYDGFRYYAEVNASTGAAYHAEKSKNLLPSLTTEQKAQIEQLDAEHGLKSREMSADFLDDVGSIAVNWISQTFQPEQRVLGAINESIFSDNSQEPLTDFNYYVILEDGTIYYVTIVWPIMEITSVTKFNEDIKQR